MLQAGAAHGRRVVCQTIRQASRPGAYPRIPEEGELGAGDAVDVDVTRLTDHGVTVGLISNAILLDHRLIPRVLEVPQLLPELREWMTARSS